MAKTSRRKFGKQLAGVVAALPVASLVSAHAEQRSIVEVDSPATVGGADDKDKDKDKDRDKDTGMDNPRPEGDPPIIVGGGGSTYIWVKRTLVPGGTLTPLPTPDPQYPIPPGELQDLKDNYYCYDISVNLVGYRTHDGENEGKRHPVKQRRKHWTRFFDK